MAKNETSNVQAPNVQAPVEQTPKPALSKFVKEQFIAAIQKAAADLKTEKPSSNYVCALASVRLIRDNMLADVLAEMPGEKFAAERVIAQEFITAFFSRLIRQITDVDGNKVRTCELNGFCGNASAAAQKAGFKAAKTDGEALME